MEITAAVTREKGGAFLVEELELDKPQKDEVLIRIAGVGICHTDLSCRDQHIPVPLPSVFGHEGSGIVEAVGEDVTKLEPGDHVVLTMLSCGTCHKCEADKPSHCVKTFELNLSGVRGDGSITMRSDQGEVHGSFLAQSSFANFALANQANAVKVSRDAPIELLGPMGCGFQTGAGAIMNALKPEKGSSIVIFGCGSVGLAGIMAAKVAGCDPIIAVDVTDSRLEMAQSLGATHLINPQTLDGDVVETIMGITQIGADYSLECSGIPQVFRQSVDCLGMGGSCALLGAAAMGTEVALDMGTLLFGKSVIGIMQGEGIPDDFIPKLVELYQQGDFPIDRLITKYPLDQINQAIEDAESGKVIKAVLVP